MHDYYKDFYGTMCLFMAKQCKTDVGFGAVLVKNGLVIGIGRNRLATKEDRDLIPYVDYCIHAEQDAIANALRFGFDVTGGNLYVLGMCLAGKNKGKLTTRTEDIFICNKCPHVFIKYNITVNIPHIEGWHPIEPYKALEIGRRMSHKGYWKDFIANVAE